MDEGGEAFIEVEDEVEELLDHVLVLEELEEGLMVLVVVVVGVEAELLCGVDVVCEVVDEECLCRVELKGVGGKVEYVFAGFGAFCFVGEDAALEEVEDGVFGEEVVFVESAGVGEEVEGVFLGELFDEVEHGLVGGEDVVPDVGELGFVSLEAEELDALFDEEVVADEAGF